MVFFEEDGCGERDWKGTRSVSGKMFEDRSSSCINHKIVLNFNWERFRSYITFPIFPKRK
jgi:hypothetical protein